MQYKGKNLEEAIKLAAETEYCSVEDIEYYVVNESEENVTIEVFTIMDVIEFAHMPLKEYPLIIAHEDFIRNWDNVSK